MDLPQVVSQPNSSQEAEQPPITIVNDAEVEMTGDDAAWIITNAFIIFTMQTGKYRRSSELPPSP